MSALSDARRAVRTGGRPVDWAAPAAGTAGARALRRHYWLSCTHRMVEASPKSCRAKRYAELCLTKRNAFERGKRALSNDAGLPKHPKLVWMAILETKIR